MITEIVVIILAILVGIWLFCIFILLPIHLIQEVFAEELPCVLYSDGKLAIVNIYFMCSGYEETISWFLKEGYHIDTLNIDSQLGTKELYMSR